MLAVGAMKERLADTARGTPMECPPPRTRETVGFFHPCNELGDGKPSFNVAAYGVEE